MRLLGDVLLLAIASQQVVALRTAKLLKGGPEAASEAALMVCEKISAAFDATETLRNGGDILSVVADYRRRVAGNVQRLSGEAS